MAPIVGGWDWWVLDSQNEEPMTMWHGGGNVVPVRGQHEGKGRSYQVGYHIYSYQSFCVRKV